MSETTDHVKTAVAKTADTDDEKVFTPAANPAAAMVGTLLGLVMLGLVVVVIRDLLIRIGWVSGSEWLHAAADWVAGIRWWNWMWALAIGLVLVGVAMIWLAVRPRRRTHLSLSGYEVMWTRRGDLARRCSAAVSTMPGVDHASTVVGRRKVTVTVTAHDAVDGDEIDRVVGAVLSAVAEPFRATVKLSSRRGGDRR
ncbi:DUF6286 domain-containing protein [Gordonia insulae]|uniref:DUF6286 domain-containing protein n=1 Tax=Gordonia insulae TaxID=2420509 RepID=A0A3G8JVS4_9ACTN|nr:DUF6286 domain-containing protein [Gordonia insulae]AZG48719.1 hypothetical protein D7316_05340 [Gordonia insulae]